MKHPHPDPLPVGEGTEFTPSNDELLYERAGSIAYLTFNRPAARNALTWAMYEGLHAACEHVDADDRVRAFILRGSGDRAFVSGTDISQFTAFSTGEDALAYERGGNRYIGRLEALRKPSIAVLRGYCTGAGAAIAAACDFRLAAPNVRYGVPIARTLGNTLSTENFARLIAMIGPARTKDLIFTARFVEADEGKAIGLFNEVVEDERLDPRARELAEQVAANAPLTIRATKEAITRILAQGPTADTDDLILMCYQSQDFAEGVRAFLDKRPPSWQGR